MNRHTDPNKDHEHVNDLSKRLLGAMQLGIYLTGADGHIWIHSDADGPDHGINDILYAGHIHINTKIYGGVLEALDTIDRALDLCGSKPLIEWYTPYNHFMGEPGVAENRISRSSSRSGGLV
jgi:hypothetical protein